MGGWVGGWVGGRAGGVAGGRAGMGWKWDKREEGNHAIIYLII